MRRCAYEDEEFPEEEFEATEQHGWIHKRTPEHTVTGEVISTERRQIPVAVQGVSPS